MSESGLHVVFGATGGVGAALTGELVDRGLLTRGVSRHILRSHPG